MRAKDAPRRNTIRMLEAAIKNAEIDKRGVDLAESDILAILQRQVKQRRESIEQFEKGGREDLGGKERVEIGIIEQYLPRQLSRDEVELRARAVIEQTGASGPGDRGKVMGMLMRELRGEADGFARQCSGWRVAGWKPLSRSNRSSGARINLFLT